MHFKHGKIDSKIQQHDMIPASLASTWNKSLFQTLCNNTNHMEVTPPSLYRQDSDIFYYQLSAVTQHNADL